MTLQLNAYVSFRDKARQAMEFYHGIFGGELTLNTFADFNASDDPAEQDMIMHAQLITDAGLVLMGSDTPSRMSRTEGTNFSLALSGDDDPTLRGYFNALADGGTVTMPLDRASWGDLFGMCTDKFGVQWMVSISSPAA
jgi:PhnB protein